MHQRARLAPQRMNHIIKSSKPAKTLTDENRQTYNQMGDMDRHHRIYRSRGDSPFACRTRVDRLTSGEGRHAKTRHKSPNWQDISWTTKQDRH